MTKTLLNFSPEIIPKVVIGPPFGAPSTHWWVDCSPPSIGMIFREFREVWSLIHNGEKKRKPQARLVTQLCLAHRPCWADPQAISASTTQPAPISSVYPAYSCDNWATLFLHARLPNEIFLVLPFKPRCSKCTFGQRWGILEHWWLFNDTNLRVLIRELHRCGLWAYQCISWQIWYQFIILDALILP